MIRLEGHSPGDVLINDEDIYIGYRRPEIVKDIKFYKSNDDLSEDIRWRLFLARQLALLKYREVNRPNVKTA